MVRIPEDLVRMHGAGWTAPTAARAMRMPVRLVRGWFRALDCRAAAEAERAVKQRTRDRVSCLGAVGVRRALLDSDRAGDCVDYPLDALRRWGLDGVPGCFGVGRE